MKVKKTILKVRQKAPRTFIAQRPKAQNISRRAYKRSNLWKKEDSGE